LSAGHDKLPPEVRAFIAVRIPPAILEELSALQRQMKNEFSDVSWTRPEAMHLTLHFLGDVKSDRLALLADALSAATHGRSSFELRFSSPGSFNNRVLWVGVGQGAHELNSLAETVRAAAKNFGSRQEDRAFNAHVTLGRFRQRVREVDPVLRKIPTPSFTPWRVRGMELMRSELSPRGSRYTVLGSFHLS
jgi:2'-5' RNA ligase